MPRNRVAARKDVPFLRQILGTKLRRLREEAGLSLEEVAKILDLNRFTVLRHESGETLVKVNDAIAYSKVYGVDGNEVLVKQLTDLARQGKQRGWWTAVGANLHPAFSYLVEAELLARDGEIRTWEPLIVPGVLQTEAYTTELLARRQHLWEQQNPLPLAEGVATRAARKEQLLGGDQPTKLWAIIGEAAIRMPVGSAQVMQDQLRHLLELSEQPNIKLQILPFSTGVHVGTAGPFILFNFGGAPVDGVVYYENSLSFSDDEDTLKRHTEQFDLLRAQAKSVPDSRSYLQEALANH
ncbi:helix-turn-helix transcriptional regulator [Kitasatospora sp. RB6PN24]|uniref:helix-turn-helix domain-containing protein n=1 Tax=Kitasatospora humi TaxID=2893891 RepID=UPI001E49C0A3|nr:helix-turn-helix transcriptional regulator [Kitasatospora humi]MCC9306362.1 helix-turn-helix transcriptional regulator [Kitasatospora humi]